MSSLKGFANVADKSALGAFGVSSPAPFDDGHVGRAPAFEFLPNAWGLHSMHGNVWEWCESRPVKYQAPYSRRGDSLAEDTPPEQANRRIIRGGSFFDGPLWARSGLRNNLAPTSVGKTIGFRPARQLF